MMTSNVLAKEATLNAGIIFEHLTKPLTWVMACFVTTFGAGLFGYKAGDVSAAYAIVIMSFSATGYAAAHVAQYRISKSLRTPQAQ